MLGKNLAPVGLSWLGQCFGVGDLTLTPYEYRSPARSEDFRSEDLNRVAVIETDSPGAFDFGSRPRGHDSLDIKVKGFARMGGRFDGEGTDAVQATKKCHEG
jgi:hypothetical protein